MTHHIFAQGNSAKASKSRGIDHKNIHVALMLYPYSLWHHAKESFTNNIYVQKAIPLKVQPSFCGK
jgi:hypothetical protein